MRLSRTPWRSVGVALLGASLLLGCAESGGPKRGVAGSSAPVAPPPLRATDTAVFESQITLPAGVERGALAERIRATYDGELTRDGKVRIETRKQGLVERVEVELEVERATARFYRSGIAAHPGYAATQVKDVLGTVAVLAREVSGEEPKAVPPPAASEPVETPPPAASEPNAPGELPLKPQVPERDGDRYRI